MSDQKTECRLEALHNSHDATRRIFRFAARLIESRQNLCAVPLCEFFEVVRLESGTEVSPIKYAVRESAITTVLSQKESAVLTGLGIAV